MSDIKFNTDLNKATFYLNEKIYGLCSIMKTAYSFIENFYIYFDYESSEVIKVEFKSKVEMSTKDLEIIVGEFQNELFYQTLRVRISKDTKNVRELILGRALYNTCIEYGDEKSNSFNICDDERDGYLEVEEDQLKIAVNWLDSENNGE